MAAASVRKCSAAYRAYWRGLTVEEKAAEKTAAARYVCEFVSAIVEGIRGEFTWQRRTGKKIYVYFRAENGERSNRIIFPPK